jgi:hypothetical protein
MAVLFFISKENIENNFFFHTKKLYFTPTLYNMETTVLNKELIVTNNLNIDVDTGVDYETFISKDTYEDVRNLVKAQRADNEETVHDTLMDEWLKEESLFPLLEPAYRQFEFLLYFDLIDTYKTLRLVQIKKEF